MKLTIVINLPNYNQDYGQSIQRIHEALKSVLSVMVQVAEIRLEPLEVPWP